MKALSLAVIPLLFAAIPSFAAGIKPFKQVRCTPFYMPDVETSPNNYNSSRVDLEAFTLDLRPVVDSAATEPTNEAYIRTSTVDVEGYKVDFEVRAVDALNESSGNLWITTYVQGAPGTYGTSSGVSAFPSKLEGANHRFETDLTLSIASNATTYPRTTMVTVYMDCELSQ